MTPEILHNEQKLFRSSAQMLQAQGDTDTTVTQKNSVRYENHHHASLPIFTVQCNIYQWTFTLIYFLAQYFFICNELDPKTHEKKQKFFLSQKRIVFRAAVHLQKLISILSFFESVDLITSNHLFVYE